MTSGTILYQEASRSFKLLSRAKTLKKAQSQSKTRVRSCPSSASAAAIDLLGQKNRPSYVFAEEGEGGRSSTGMWKGVSQVREWRPFTKEYVKDESKFL